FVAAVYDRRKFSGLSFRAERGISQSKRGSHNVLSMINQLVGDPSHSFGMTIQNINRVFPVPRSIRPIRFARSPRDESVRAADNSCAREVILRRPSWSISPRDESVRTADLANAIPASVSFFRIEFSARANNRWCANRSRRVRELRRRA